MSFSSFLAMKQSTPLTGKARNSQTDYINLHNVGQDTNNLKLQWIGSGLEILLAKTAVLEVAVSPGQLLLRESNFHSYLPWCQTFFCLQIYNIEISILCNSNFDILFWHTCVIFTKKSSHFNIFFTALSSLLHIIGRASIFHVEQVTFYS